MSVPRVPCRSEDCSNTILPATAAANDGYCAPCVAKRKHAEREEYIRANRRRIDPGSLDPIELIAILHTRPYDPLIEWTVVPKAIDELYRGLSSDEVARLKRMAIEALRGERSAFAEEVAQSFATFTTVHLDDLLEAWVSANHLWPSVIFRGAGQSIRDRIVEAIDNGSAEVNHALSALAWIGDQKVVELFRIWEAEPPWWRRSLHAGPSRYAHVAGWEPTVTGRRNLYFERCFSLTPAHTGVSVPSSVDLLSQSDENCRWCGASMVHVIDLDLSNPSFAFLEFPHQRLPVLTCYRCTCYGDHLFAQIGKDGRARWLESNVRPDWLPDESPWPMPPWYGVSGQLSSRRAVHAAGFCTSASVSQLGGLPSWVQDTAYPGCPGCKRTMTFLAQLDNGQFPGYEGVYYAFVCVPCGITATTYQQT